MSKPRGLYTPVYQSLVTHRKTKRAASALKCHRLKLVGHLVALWTWSLGNMPRSGGPLSPEDVAFAAEWPERDGARFCNVLLDCGFIEEGEDGYYLHEWDQYGGKVAETAAKDRVRKRGIPVEFHRNSGGGSGGIPTLEETETETRREEDETRSSVSLTGAQERIRDRLHDLARDRVFGGVNAPDSDWCEDLVLRGATESDIEAATDAARRKSLPYCRAVLERRVKEREAGNDPDAVPERAANTGAGRGYSRATQQGRLARNGAVAREAADDFDDLPPHAIRATDDAGAPETDSGAGTPIRFPGRDRASGGAR